MTLNDSGAYICARREAQPQGAFRGQIAAGAGGAAREHAYSTRPRETHAEPRKAQTRAEAVVGHCLAHAADSLVRPGPGRQGILDEFVHTQNTLASLSLIPVTWDIYRTGSRRSKARGNICAGSCRSYSAPGTLFKRAHQAVGLPLTGAALPSRHVPISLVLNCDAAVHSAAAIPHPSATSLPTLCATTLLLFSHAYGLCTDSMAVTSDDLALPFPSLRRLPTLAPYETYARMLEPSNPQAPSVLPWLSAPRLEHRPVLLSPSVSIFISGL
ncbi:hypothetical protein FB451DRAFT_1185981 [Mycena latifolia]|nr:hypothetical protein FB451DRAFT_1185981 [Mycena latifolia]